MTDTLHLALPYIEAAQAQKHVTHNEALRILDAVVMLAVKDRDLSAPPGSPSDGDRYLVKPTGSGAFAGKDQQIAHYRDGAWAFHSPRAGWVCFVEDEDALLVFDGDEWMPLLGDSPAFQNVALLGIGTTADATNPLSAKLNNALWTARTIAEGGDGDLRYKLNKEASGNTLSMLLQTGFSGRAEIGLTGDDDLHLKVSADGSSWTDALRLATDGATLGAPAGGKKGAGTLNAAAEFYVNNNAVYRAGGTDVAIADGGTGASDARAAMANLKGVYVLAASAVAVSHTGNTSETALATIAVPAGAMGSNGIVRVTTVWTCTNSANNKTGRVRFGGLGGTAYGQWTETTNISFRAQCEIANRNSASSQVGFALGTGSANEPGWGATGSTNVTSSIDTSAGVDVVISALLANSGETVTLERYLVELIVP